MKKVKGVMETIDNLMEDILDDDLNTALGKIEKFKEKLKKYRSSGLEKDGEFSYENLVFKFLRRNQYIDKLYNFKNKLMDKKLSLENQETE
jgi:hypothetical protein